MVLVNLEFESPNTIDTLANNQTIWFEEMQETVATHKRNAKKLYCIWYSLIHTHIDKNQIVLCPIQSMYIHPC